MRGWLKDEHGVALHDVHWYQAAPTSRAALRRWSSAAARRPAHPCRRQVLSEMVASGEIDCALIARPPNTFLAGIPTSCASFRTIWRWRRPTTRAPSVADHAHHRDPHACARRPSWVARNLFNAFVESKRRSLERLLDPAVSRYPLAWLPTYARKMRDLFDGDPFPYGIEENRPTLEQFLRYTHEQGIAHRHAKPEEIFPKGIMTSVKV